MKYKLPESMVVCAELGDTKKYRLMERPMIVREYLMTDEKATKSSAILSVYEAYCYPYEMGQIDPVDPKNGLVKKETAEDGSPIPTERAKLVTFCIVRSNYDPNGTRVAIEKAKVHFLGKIIEVTKDTDPWWESSFPFYTQVKECETKYNMLWV